MISPSALRGAAYRWLHRMSLTRRLVAVVLLLVLGAYLVTMVVTSTLLRGYLVERVDAELGQALRPLGLSTVTEILEGDGTALLRRSGYVPPNRYYVVFAPADGSAPIPLSFPFQGHDPEVGVPDASSLTGNGPYPVGSAFDLPARDGDGTWRALTAGVTDANNRVVGTVTVAVPLTGVDSTVDQLTLYTVSIGLVVLVLVGVLGWFAVRRAFRPLTRIEDTAAAIADGDLTRRVPPRAANDEVGSLSESINRMLAQVEHSFGVREASEQRMRDFVADASHELRTPLATVKGYAELYRVGAVSPEDVGGAMRRIEDEATRMTRLVEDLLTLTRLDSEPSMTTTRVDLTVLAGDVVQDARVRAPERHVALEPLAGSTGGGLPVVVGDDGALRQVLTNLVANALAHTPDGTPVEVAVGTVGDRVVVEVRDHGTGLDAAVAERVFERFYRADRSRSRASGGTGLGLPIAAAIAARHGGTVRHAPTPGGGATFRVDLPRAPGLPEDD